MRRRLILAISAVAIAGLALAACDGSSDDSDDASGQAAGLAERTVKAGEVDVKIEPTQLDTDGATFKIVLDTHAVELSMDIARSARLEVGDTAWDVAGWTGDGPGGHHREGELRFTASGPARGTARLTLSGFPGPVAASWALGS